MTAAKPIRVLVIDDSVFMRTMLKKAFTDAPGFEVVGTAQNGREGLEKIRSKKPDVATLDLEMPVSGMYVLENLTRADKTGIVVVSTKTQRGAAATVEALEAGAVDVVAKPLGKPNSKLEDFFESVTRAARGAAGSRRQQAAAPVAAADAGDLPQDVVVAIGISAGGPQTLHRLMPALPASFPPVVITQHMPAGFTGPFAERLNTRCAMEIAEASEGRPLEPGLALIAPGDQHLRVVKRAGKLVAHLSRGPKVSGFRPAVDVMFDSLAAECGSRTVAAVLTGMGSDGSAGVRLLKAKGAAILSQDQASSVVYGMPKAAFETGCVDRVVSLERMASALAEAARGLASVKA